MCRRPPPLPPLQVFRTLEADHFDGRVSAEFRVKDAESGERGVTLLMGRLAHSKAHEAQVCMHVHACIRAYVHTCIRACA